MGICYAQTAEDLQNALVDQELEHDRKIGVNKLLLLGSGGSGKSTIFKQLKGIYGTGFDQRERRMFVVHIHEQVISQMLHALLVLDEYRNETGASHDVFSQNERLYVDNKLHFETPTFTENESMTFPDTLIPTLSEEGLEARAFLKRLHCSKYKLTDEIVAALKCLWSEPAIRKMYQMRNITNIYDSSAYFWNKLDSLNTRSYVPDEADIYLVRHRTTGATEELYETENASFSIVDVGGQQSERRKWIQWFDSVTAVIFVASLSCYDEVLFEDYTVNSMVDQLELFDSVVNNHAFIDTNFILFLNKKDLFVEKVQDIAITKCPSFVTYRGDPHSFDETTKYIRKQFTSLQKEGGGMKHIYFHVTCATDHDNIRKVFVDVQATIVSRSMSAASLI